MSRNAAPWACRPTGIRTRTDTLSSDSVDYGGQGHGGQGGNFAFPTTVDPGTRYLAVSGLNAATGAYTLVSSFAAEDSVSGRGPGRFGLNARF